MDFFKKKKKLTNIFSSQKQQLLICWYISSSIFMHINIFSLESCMKYMILFLYMKICTFPYINFKMGFIFEALYYTIWIYLTFFYSSLIFGHYPYICKDYHWMKYFQKYQNKIMTKEPPFCWEFCITLHFNHWCLRVLPLLHCLCYSVCACV